MTDRELRSLMEQSPGYAQRLIFDKYCGYVYAVCANRLKNIASSEDIDECVSDAFAAVFRYFDSPSDRDGDIKGIIGTIARRTAINAYRSLSRKYGLSVPIDEELSGSLRSSHRVDEDAERKAVREILLDCIGKLGEPDSSIVIFHYFYGKTYKQIASRTGLSDAAVQKRISRSRDKLRKLLREAGITEEG